MPNSRGATAGSPVLVDGSNVAHATEGGEARLDNIELVMRKLTQDGFKPLIVADAALRHQIDNKPAYEKLIDDGVVHQAPAGTDADYFILSFARQLGARILSNDRFRDRAKEFGAERDRIIRYMIVNGAVVLEQRTRRRNGGYPSSRARSASAPKRRGRGRS